MPHPTLRRIGFALFVTALLIAGWMYWRMTNQELWGSEARSFTAYRLERLGQLFIELLFDCLITL